MEPLNDLNIKGQGGSMKDTLAGVMELLIDFARRLNAQEQAKEEMRAYRQEVLKRASSTSVTQ